MMILREEDGLIGGVDRSPLRDASLEGPSCGAVALIYRA